MRRGPAGRDRVTSSHLLAKCERCSLILDDCFHEVAEFVSLELCSATGIGHQCLESFIDQPSLHEFQVVHLFTRRNLNHSQTSQDAEKSKRLVGLIAFGKSK